MFVSSRCKHCKVKFSAEERGRALHEECVDSWIASQVEKMKKAKAKKVKADKAQERAQIRTRKEAIKTIPELIAEAQREFNSWIRARDRDKPCVSCNAPPPDLSGLHAGRDAGHYRSVGSASHLRFHEDNVHAQCVECNKWKAGNAVDYRIGLVQRIGIDRVEALEQDNTPRKWVHDEVRAIRDTYRKKLKEMKKC